MTNNWEKLDYNYVLERKNYYISYNPNTKKCASSITDIANTISSIGTSLGLDDQGEFKDGPETALYDHKVWRILEGDFRKEYENCKSLKECIKFYKSNLDKRSNWSTDKI